MRNTLASHVGDQSCFLIYRPIGIIVNVFANGSGNRVSISSHTKDSQNGN